MCEDKLHLTARTNNHLCIRVGGFFALFFSSSLEKDESTTIFTTSTWQALHVTCRLIFTFLVMPVLTSSSVTGTVTTDGESSFVQENWKAISLLTCIKEGLNEKDQLPTTKKSSSSKQAKIDKKELDIIVVDSFRFSAGNFPWLCNLFFSIYFPFLFF